MAALLTQSLARSQDWSRFRGAEGAGIGSALDLPDRPTADDFAWSLSLPGSGQSSPVVYGDDIYLSAVDDEQSKRLFLCIDAQSGLQRWACERPFTPHRLNASNSFVASSASADESGPVFLVTSGKVQIALALARDGALLWERELCAWDALHGQAASPVLYHNLVLIAAEDEDEDACFMALDRTQGHMLWRMPRPAAPASFTTPLLIARAGTAAQAIFLSAGQALTSLNPNTGEVYWQRAGAGRETVVASPIFANGLLFVPGKWGVQALELDLSKPNEAPQERYRVRRASPQVPTPLVADGLLFLWGDEGVVSCVDAETGAELWRERLSAEFYSSPIFADGRLWTLARSGELFVLRVSANFQTPLRVDLGEESDASAACAEYGIYLRTKQRLLLLPQQSQQAGLLGNDTPHLRIAQVRTLFPSVADELSQSENCTIEIADGQVTALLQGQQVGAARPGELLVQGPQPNALTLSPGLADADADLEDPGELAFHLLHGVELLCLPRGRPRHLEWRGEISRGERLGPRLLVGRTLAGKLSPKKARDLVRKAAQDGYDFVRLAPSLSQEALARAVEDARAWGLPIWGVPSGTSESQNGGLQPEVVSSLEPLLAGTKAALEAELQAQAALRDCARSCVVTGLHGFAAMARSALDLDGLLAGFTDGDLAPHWREVWGPAGHGLRRAPEAEEAAELAHSLQLQRALVQRLAENRAALVPSSQALTSFVLPGIGLHQELAAWLEAGIPRTRALQLAWQAAAHLTRRRDLGVLTAGAAAEFVLLAGRPEEELSALRNVVGVVRAGRWLPRSEIEHEVELVRARWRVESPYARSIARREGGVREAVAAHRAEREIDPQAPFLCEENLERCAELMNGIGRRDDALVLVQYGLELFPESAWLYLRRAQIHAKSQRTEDARSDLLRAEALNPNLLEAQELRATLERPAPATPPERKQRPSPEDGKNSAGAV